MIKEFLFLYIFWWT